MANSDALYAHFTTLTDVDNRLSGTERMQLVNTLTFFIRNTRPFSTNIRDFNLVTIRNSPSISNKLQDGYRIDVTFRNKPIVVGCIVPTRHEVLEGLRHSLEEQAGPDMVDVLGRSSTLRVHATDEPTMKAHVNRKRQPIGFVMRDKEQMRAAAGIVKRSFTESDGGEVSKEELSHKPQERRPDASSYDQGSRSGHASQGTKSEFGHLGATIINGCTVNRAAGQIYPRLSAKLPESKRKTHTSEVQEKSEMESGKAADVRPDMADEEMDDGEFCERSDAKMEDHEREHGDPEERESVPTIGDALAKFAAGELRSRKWKGRVDELEARQTCDEMVVEEEEESDDEQRIVGQDDAFWRDR